MSEHGCLDIDPVDLNAYRVLDLECLAKIAWELGLDDEGAAHREAADALRRLVNDHLWDPDRETYADRRWDGSFARCRTASHFLVLAAGIAPEGRARRMVEHLTDESLFWGDYVVPTISRDDPRFAEQQYWRGTIWPPINYLIHMGLARYGFDAEAAAVAERGARMFLEDRRGTGLCRENFDSRTGEGGGQRHQSWGPLFALTALEELADVTPWDGLRVGGLRPGSRTELTNLDLGPRGVFDLAVGPEGLALRVDGEPVLQTDAPAVLRGLELGRDRMAAEVSCDRELSLWAHLAGSRWVAELDGRREKRSAPVVRVQPGRTRVTLRALD
ncbi:MAG: amylo-alpha-1,6-glucosidase [Gemmatimonadota bacterium]